MNSLSVSDATRLVTDIRVVVEMICPDVDARKLISRLEELLGNYKVERRRKADLALDMDAKIEMFLDAMRTKSLSELTLEGYQRDLNIFSKFVNKPTVQVTTADVRRYLAANRKNAVSTRSKKLTIIRSFFSWLVKEEEILRDPTARIDQIKLPKRLSKGLSLKELELVRESCKTLRQRAIVEVLYSTGCRLSEVTGIKREKIDYHDMSVRVIGKGDKERVVYFSHRCMYHLDKYLKSRKDDCKYLFTTVRKPYRKMGNRALQREVFKINSYVKINSKLTPHIFRHTLANNLLNNGADLADVQEILGHVDPNTTLIYSKVSEVRKKRAFEKSHIQ